MCTPGGQQSGNPQGALPGDFFCAFCLLTFWNECGIMEPALHVRAGRFFDRMTSFNNFWGKTFVQIDT